MVEIVRTPDTMDGFPRLKGRRIGVHHIVPMVEAYGGVEQAAESLNISVDAVRAAVEYAEAHPDVMAEVERERRESLELVREQTDLPDGSSVDEK